MNKTSAAETFDLIVLGTGPAGSTVSQLAARAGAKVAVIESRQPGGTCALRGCNPKKVLALSAELTDWSKLAQGKLVTGGPLSIDWSELRSFTKEFTDPVPARTRSSFDDDGITLIEGSPTFLDPHHLEVDGVTYEARAICLAIGTRPVVPDLPGIEHGIQSGDFFEMEELPKSLLFAGGGYISMEFSHVAARAGSSVRLLDTGERPLRGFEPELVEALVERSKEAGITFHSGTALKRIDKAGSGYEVTFGPRDSSDEDSTAECDLVVLGLGREVDTQGLDLEKAGVELDGGLIVNSDFSCRGADHIFAAGDCAKTDRPHLTMAANIEAGHTLESILSLLGLEAPSQRYEAAVDAIPAVVFTAPHLARVGLSEEDAKEKYPKLVVRSGDRSHTGSVRKRGETHARYKILIDEETDRVVGAHFLGPGADEFVNIVALAMQCDLSVTRLKKGVFAFPTFASELAKCLS